MSTGSWRGWVIAIPPDGFNVIKFASGSPQLSLLRYRAFFEDGFPALDHSWSVDLAAGTVRLTSYEGHRDPPILHRKEQLIPQDHALQREFQSLTRAAEEAGLLEATSDIGRKRAWDVRLKRVGLTVVGNRLVDAGEGAVCL